MSAIPDTRAVSISTAGYEDGLGRRSVRFDREVGGMLECLHLRPELWAFEANLRDAAAAIASLDDERFVRVSAIERGLPGLVVVSEVVPGQRLLDIIDTRQRDDDGAFGIDASLGFLLQSLPALSTLHTLSIAHGALAPGRILVTGAGQIVLLDGIYAAALERLNLSRVSMWTHLGLLTPPLAGAPRFDRAADLAQAALCGLVLAVGRSVTGAGDTAALAPLLNELREVAEIRGGRTFAASVQEFFQALLPAANRRATLSADVAAAQAEQLAEMIGEEGCHAAFSQLARIAPTIARSTTGRLNVQEEFEAYADSDDVEETDAPADFEALPALPPQPVKVSPLAPVVGTTTAPAPVPPVTVAPVGPPANVVEAPAVPAPVPSAVVTPAASVLSPPQSASPVSVPAPPIADVRVAPPANIVEAPAVPPPVPSAVLTPAATVVAPPISAPAVVAPPAPVPVAPPVPVPVLTTAPAVVPAPLPPVTVPPMPVTPPVAVFATVPVAPSATVPPPTVQPTTVFTSAPIQAAPQPPAPVAYVPTPPAPPPPIAVLAPRPAVPPAPAPAPPPTGMSPAAPAPLKVRQEPPPGFTPARREPDAADRALPFVDRAVPEQSSPFPWKLAAAAIIVLAVGIAGGRTYLQDNADVAPVVEPPKPVAAAVPAPTTGTSGGLAIDTQPSGAKITLDGVDVGVAPLKLDSVAPGKHVVVVSTDTATIRRTIRVEPGRVVSLDVPVFSGWVSVFSPIPLDIAEEGKTLGNTDTGKILLPPGRHVLTLSNSEFGFSDTRSVEIQPGEERPLNIEPKGTVNVNAHPWAEVWIDGKKAGDTPIANLAVLMGTRIFTFKHPQYGERRLTVTVTASAAPISVDFTKP